MTDKKGGAGVAGVVHSGRGLIMEDGVGVCKTEENHQIFGTQFVDTHIKQGSLLY